jgi:chromosome partitioning protein
MGKTISLLNMKGGVGKTTLAVNIAWYMHEKEGHNVLLIDLDPQFNSTQYLMQYNDFIAHSRDKGTMADILIDEASLSLKPKKKNKNGIKQSIYCVNNGGKCHFDFVPSELRLAFVVKNPAQMDFALEKALMPIRDEYDFIFIDCAPTDSVLTTMALNASDYVLVPVRPERFAILGFANFLASIGDFKQKCPDPHNVRELGMIFSQVTNNSPVEDDCISEVSALALKQNSYVFKSRLKYSPTYPRAVRDQTPIYRTKYARNRVISDLRGITLEIKNRISQIEGNK